MVSSNILVERPGMDLLGEVPFGRHPAGLQSETCSEAKDTTDARNPTLTAVSGR